ncbi:hypothetical protein ACH3XW_46790 [Acanthocheilonema viteae]
MASTLKSSVSFSSGFILFCFVQKLEEHSSEDWKRNHRDSLISYEFDESTKRTVKIEEHNMMQCEDELSKELLSHYPEYKVDVLEEVRNMGHFGESSYFLDLVYAFELT